MFYIFMFLPITPCFLTKWSYLLKWLVKILIGPAFPDPPDALIL